MAQIFISYSRVDRPFVQDVARRLRRVYGSGSVWFDEELHGGEVWWQKILSQIAGCDIFIYMVTRESVDSEYCRAELAEARRLHKQILPVLARARTPIPEDLGDVQMVDMSAGITVDSMTDLQSAITYLAGRVPDRLPEPALPQPVSKPDVPVRRAPAARRSTRAIWAMGAVVVMLAIAVIVLALNGVFGGGEKEEEGALATHTPDAESFAGTLIAMNHTGTARAWTAAPSPDMTQTLQAGLERQSTETAQAATPVPTRTLEQMPTATPEPTSTPKPTSDGGVAVAFIPAGSPNADWPPVLETVNGLPMAYVPAGCFMMGSDDDEDSERPAHEVCLSAFWIEQTEVTNDQYKGCVFVGACTPPEDRTYYDDPAYADHPVMYVDWGQASIYAAWVGGSLPTEAQWEYAARGPEGLVFPWGDTFDETWLNYCDAECEFDWRDSANDDGYAMTSPAGDYPDGASWVGALDMAGNVWEWTSTIFADYPYVTDDGRENGSNSAALRVARSGSWSDDWLSTRAASRLELDPVERCTGLGFRVVVAPGDVVTAEPLETEPTPIPAW